MSQNQGSYVLFHRIKAVQEFAPQEMYYKSTGSYDLESIRCKSFQRLLFLPNLRAKLLCGSGPKIHAHTRTHSSPRHTSSDQALKCNKRIQVEEPLILNETSWLKKKKNQEVWMPGSWCLTKGVWHAVGTSPFQEKNVQLTCLASPPPPLSPWLSLSPRGSPFPPPPPQPTRANQRKIQVPPTPLWKRLSCLPPYRQKLLCVPPGGCLSWKPESQRQQGAAEPLTFEGWPPSITYACLKQVPGSGREAAERAKSEANSNTEFLADALEHGLFTKLRDLKLICDSHKPMANLHCEVRMLALSTGTFLFIYYLFLSPSTYLRMSASRG